MRRDEVLAMFQREKSVEKIPSKVRFYGGIQSNILAQAVNYCFDTGIVATFKDLDDMFSDNSEEKDCKDKRANL